MVEIKGQITRPLTRLFSPSPRADHFGGGNVAVGHISLLLHISCFHVQLLASRAVATTSGTTHTTLTAAASQCSLTAVEVAIVSYTTYNTHTDTQNTHTTGYYISFLSAIEVPHFMRYTNLLLTYLLTYLLTTFL